jgi:hypothetical protein
MAALMVLMAVPAFAAGEGCFPNACGGKGGGGNTIVTTTPDVNRANPSPLCKLARALSLLARCSFRSWLVPSRTPPVLPAHLR